MFVRISVVYEAIDMGQLFQVLGETCAELLRNDAMRDGQGMIIVFSLVIS